MREVGTLTRSEGEKQLVRETVQRVSLMQSATVRQQIDPARQQQTSLIGKGMHQMPRNVTIAVPLKK